MVYPGNDALEDSGRASFDSTVVDQGAKMLLRLCKPILAKRLPHSDEAGDQRLGYRFIVHLPPRLPARLYIPRKSAYCPSFQKLFSFAFELPSGDI